MRRQFYDFLTFTKILSENSGVFRKKFGIFEKKISRNFSLFFWNFFSTSPGGELEKINDYFWPIPRTFRDQNKVRKLDIY